ncbi:MAG: sodium:solute symporter family protein [Gemmatimonadales bacterium]|nr:MAG: sodium:solute symporter family protein [Gemmatimonadales bacterium]
MTEVNPYYLATFILYLVVVLAIGVWAYTRTRNVMDFWVFGQDMGPVLATWSLVANFVSSVSVIGFIGAVYVDGYSLMTHTILGLMLGLAALYMVVGVVRRLNVLTFPDLIARVTGYEAARPLGGIVLLASGWLYLIMQLVGAGLLITAITGVPYEYMVWVIGGVFILYTVMGGLVSVAWTDLLQGLLMVGAVAVALIYMMTELGGLSGINFQFAALDSSLVHPTGEGQYTLLYVAAMFLAFFGTILTEQDMLIRIAATRDIRTAKIHIAAAGVILSIFYSGLVILGGATTVALIGSGLAVDERPDAAFPTLITEYLPTGVGVVIILAVMSAILSTTDTRLHATGMTVARDIYSYFRPKATDSRLMGVSRIATIVLGLSATWAAIDPPGTIIVLYGLRAVLLTSAFLVPVYLAVFWSDLSGLAVVLAIAVGGTVGLTTHLMGGGIGAIPSTFLGVGSATLVVLLGQLILSRREGTRGGAA